MGIVLELKSIIESDKQVKAKDAKEAESLFREKMKKNWPDAKSIEITSVVKGG